MAYGWHVRASCIQQSVDIECIPEDVGDELNHRGGYQAVAMSVIVMHPIMLLWMLALLCVVL